MNVYSPILSLLIQERAKENAHVSDQKTRRINQVIRDQQWSKHLEECDEDFSYCISTFTCQD